MKKIISAILTFIMVLSIPLIGYTAGSVQNQPTNISVFTAKTVAVKSVKISRTDLTILKGKTYKLNATVNPSNATNKGVTWKSSNKNIATVSGNGTVKGIKTGTAVVYIHTRGGDKIAKCKVNVILKYNYEVDARFYAITKNNAIAKKADLEAVKSVIENRLDSRNIYIRAVTINASKGYIRVQILKKRSLSFAKSTIAALQLIAKYNLLTFREVNGNKLDNQGYYLPTGKIIIQGNDVKSAKAELDISYDNTVIAISLTTAGTKKFAEATARLINKPIGIFMDSHLITAPIVQAAITNGKVNITGQYTPEEAKDLASTINAGTLPFKLKVAVQKG